MRFRVLGSVEAVAPDGSAHQIGSRSQRAVLASLLARPGEAVSIDGLAEAVWGDDPPPTAIGTLRSYVSRRRAAVGDVIQPRGQGYALDVDQDEVDAGRFEQLLRQQEPGEPAALVAKLEAALALWRGPAFGEMADLPTVRAEARRLDELRWSAVENFARAQLDCGHAHEAVATAEMLVTIEPLREGAWEVLVEALARAGRPAEALRAFRRASEALAEAGLEPTAQLREVERRVVSGIASRRPLADRPSVALSVESAKTHRSAVPAYSSSFVGRDVDCRQVNALLDDVRVVTLVGPGGVGKTRLAMEVARDRAIRISQPVFVVDLASLDDAASVPDAVAAQLGLPAGEGSSLDALGRAGALDALVVLDNAEHVIEGVAETVEAMTRGGDRLQTLVTSRERVGVDGEHVWHVAPLPVEGSAAPARRLFVDRSRAANGLIVLDPDDPRLARVVARLDGLPLALEMAAAQLATVSVDELADALDERVDGLRSPRRGEAGRHRSLNAVLEWSEDLLAAEEVEVLADLSVFAGPVTARDINAVLERDDADVLARSLAERSVVSVERSTSPSRLYLLQTVRSHAARRLAATGKQELLAGRHAEWFAGEAARCDALLRTADEGQAATRLESMLAELRVAFRWALDREPVFAGRLAASLHHFAHSRLVAEPLHWAEIALTRLDDQDSSTPVLLASAATRAILRGDLERATELAERAIVLAPDDPRCLPALEALGHTSLYSGQLERAERAYSEAVRLASAGDDPYYLVVGETGLALVGAYGGQGRVVFEPPHPSPSPSPTVEGWVAYARGELAAPGDPDAAFECYERAAELASSVGNRFLEGIALLSGNALQARVGDIGRSLEAFGRVVRHWMQLADHTHQLTTLRNLVVLLQRAEDAPGAAHLIGAVDCADVPTYGEEAVRLREVQDWAIGEIGPDDVERLTSQGRALDVAGTAEWALARIDELGGRR